MGAEATTEKLDNPELEKALKEFYDKTREALDGLKDQVVKDGKNQNKEIYNVPGVVEKKFSGVTRKQFIDHLPDGIKGISPLEEAYAQVFGYGEAEDSLPSFQNLAAQSERVEQLLMTQHSIDNDGVIPKPEVEAIAQKLAAERPEAVQKAVTAHREEVRKTVEAIKTQDPVGSVLAEYPKIGTNPENVKQFLKNEYSRLLTLFRSKNPQEKLAFLRKTSSAPEDPKATILDRMTRSEPIDAKRGEGQIFLSALNLQPEDFENQNKVYAVIESVGEAFKDDKNVADHQPIDRKGVVFNKEAKGSKKLDYSNGNLRTVEKLGELLAGIPEEYRGTDREDAYVNYLWESVQNQVSGVKGFVVYNAENLRDEGMTEGFMTMIKKLMIWWEKTGFGKMLDKDGKQTPETPENDHMNEESREAYFAIRSLSPDNRDQLATKILAIEDQLGKINPAGKVDKLWQVAVMTPDARSNFDEALKYVAPDKEAPAPATDVIAQAFRQGLTPEALVHLWEGRGEGGVNFGVSGKDGEKIDRGFLVKDQKKQSEFVSWESLRTHPDMNLVEIKKSLEPEEKKA